MSFRLLKILWATFFLLRFGGLGSQSMNVTDSLGRKQGKWELYKTDTANGVITKYRSRSGLYVDDKKEGIWEDYYPSGEVLGRLFYVNDTINGLTQMYGSNGVVTESGFWQGSKKRWIGDYQLYYDNGTPRQKFTYDSDGNHVGFSKYYYPNERIAILRFSIRGQANGYTMFFDSLTGSVDSMRFFRDGIEQYCPYDTNAPAARMFIEKARAENSIADRRKMLAQTQQELLLKEAEVSQQIKISEKEKLIRYIVTAAGALTVMLLIFLFYRFKITKRQQAVIAAQKQGLEEKRKEVHDSLKYAERLQQAILPSSELINSSFTDSFLLYFPKDIVSGDFYWIEHVGPNTLIAVADCTGHGVPGALMSVLCASTLERVIKEYGIIEPGKILDQVTELLDVTFSKSNFEVKDGMDISLCCVNRDDKKLFWAGANNSLWLICADEIKIIAADRQPVGKHEHRKSFTTHSMTITDNMSVFLFTDGYADQFGGPKEKKFKYKALQEILFNNRSLSMKEQSRILTEKFTLWKGELEQVDDVTIIGFRA